MASIVTNSAGGGRGDWLAAQAAAGGANPIPQDDETIPLPNLLSPLKVGEMHLLNRVVMAPLTRCRATRGSDHVPNGVLMAEYYSQRASPGSLIVAEATMTQTGHSTFWNEPGCYNAEQATAWKVVVDAVHAKGGFIYLQLCHGGRSSHPFNSASDAWDCLAKEDEEGKGEEGNQEVRKTVRGTDGNQPVAPSAMRIEAGTLRGFFNPSGEPLEYVEPRALTLEEITGSNGVIAAFVTSAHHAIVNAGFDGVEIHAANGYLLDQFMRSSANSRPLITLNSSGVEVEDPYNGQSTASRCQILLDVINGIAEDLKDAHLEGKLRIRTAKKKEEAEGARPVEEFDPYRLIGVRISPLNSFQDMIDESPLKFVEYLSQQLSSSRSHNAPSCPKLHLPEPVAYLHLMRGDFLKKQTGDVITVAREHLGRTKGERRTVLMTNMGYSPLEADRAIKDKVVDCVAFGTLFINNPDLVARLECRGTSIEDAEAEGAEKKKTSDVDGIGKPFSYLSEVKPRMQLYYTHGAEGYTDYPVLKKGEGENKEEYA